MYIIICIYTEVSKSLMIQRKYFTFVILWKELVNVLVFWRYVNEKYNKKLSYFQWKIGKQFFFSPVRSTGTGANA